MAYISELPHINYNITPSYIDTDSIRREMKKILANGHFGIAQLYPHIEKKGSNEMENEKMLSLEKMFRMIIDSHTYIYFKGYNSEVKDEFYSTLEFIKRTLKQDGFERKEIIIVEKVLDLLETLFDTYDDELKMSKPELKAFNNILCDIKQSLSEIKRI